MSPVRGKFVCIRVRAIAQQFCVYYGRCDVCLWRLHVLIFLMIGSLMVEGVFAPFVCVVADFWSVGAEYAHFTPVSVFWCCHVVCLGRDVAGIWIFSLGWCLGGVAPVLRGHPVVDDHHFCTLFTAVFCFMSLLSPLDFVSMMCTSHT